MNEQTVLPDLDPTALRDAVRRALTWEGAEVVDWRAEPIGRAFVNLATGGIARLSGTASDGDETRRWSLIFKVAVHPAGDFLRFGDPSDARYWKREAVIYESGILDGLPPGVTAPRCLGVLGPSPDRVWLFLEDVEEDARGQWPIERYALAARHLGRFNGAYLVGRPLPHVAGLSRDFLRLYVEPAGRLYDRLADVRDQPVVRQTWPFHLLERQARLFADREAFFSALAHLPPAFCHLDAWRTNLLSRRLADGTIETVAIDWALAGIGVVGEDLAPLVGWEPYVGLREPEDLPALDAAAFAAYVQGLRDVGWTGDARLARLGFTAAVAQRYGNAPFWGAVGDAAMTARLDTAYGVPLAELLARAARVVTYHLDRGDEARTLIRELGLG